MARVIVAAAALRQESRGAHYRADCPDLKPEWTGHFLFNNQMICFKDKGNRITMAAIPLLHHLSGYLLYSMPSLFSLCRCCP